MRIGKCGGMDFGRGGDPETSLVRRLLVAFLMCAVPSLGGCPPGWVVGPMDQTAEVIDNDFVGPPEGDEFDQAQDLELFDSGLFPEDDITAMLTEDGVFIYEPDAGGGPGEAQVIPIPPASKPTAIEFADLDGDGDGDLILGRFELLSTVLNHGASGFAAPVAQPSPGENITTTDNFVGKDLDGDGFADMVWATADVKPPSAPVSQVKVFKSAGNGGFLAPVVFDASGTLLGQPAAGEVDATPGPEIAVTDTQSVLMFRQIGGGALGLISSSTGATLAPGSPLSQARVSFPGTPREVTIADMNNDGKGDLVTTDFVNVYIKPGVGNGTFGSVVTLTGRSGTQGVAVGDVNGDGIPEVFSVNSNDDTVNVWKATGALTYAPRVDIPTGSAPNSLVLYDLDVDGFLDIVAANRNDKCVVGYPGRGDGTFLAPQRLATSASTTSVAAGDFNGDGYTDVAAVTSLGEAHVFLNKADNSGTLLDFAPTSGESIAFNIGKVLALEGDYSGSDGRERMAIQVSDRFAWFRWDENQPVGSRVVFQGLSITSGTIKSTAAADLNGDGRTDIVTAFNTAAPAAQAWLQDGAGGFPSGTPLNSAASGWDIAIAPSATPGSGLPPGWVILHETSTGASAVYDLDAGAFSLFANFSTGAASVDVAMGDVDGDGVADLITAHPGSGTTGRRISVQTHMTSATPPSPVSVDLPRTPARVASGDVDGDGDDDVIVATAGPTSQNQEMMILLNEGGTLDSSLVRIYPVGGQPRQLVLADLHLAKSRGGGIDRGLASLSGPEFITADFDPPNFQLAGSVTVLPNRKDFAPPPPPCLQDLNGDQAINTLDLILLLQVFGQIVPPAPAGRDINQDGAINTLDLILLLQRFGQACG